MNADGDGDGARLDTLLRSAVAQVEPPDSEAIYSRVRARVLDETSRGETTTPGVASRRLAVLVARESVGYRRRRAGRAAAIALAVAVAGVGTAAAAEFLPTRTGEFLTGWQRDAGGPGEVLYKGGTNYPAVLRDITRDIPFAPGYEDLREAVYASPWFAPAADTATTEGTVRGGFAEDAICTWADAWVGADDAGNSELQASVTRTLRESLRWDAVVALDPNPSPTGRMGDLGPAETRFGWLPAIVDAAEASDRQALLDAVAASGRCMPNLVPAMQADPSYQGPR